MSELLKSAISEIDYALVSNKGGKEVREHYLNNAKRFINEAEKEQEIQLNADQRIVFEYLKEFMEVVGSPIAAVNGLYFLNEVEINSIDLVDVGIIKRAYMGLSTKEEIEVLQAFAEWGLSNDK